MIDFVEKMVGELGIGEPVARQATGGMLQLLQQNASGGDFQSLLGKLPGAEAMLADAPSEASASGGLGGLGGLVGKASSLLGKDAGGALGVLSSLGAAGLSLEDAPKFASSFLGFAQGKAGSDLMGKLLENVPDLKKFL